MNGLPKIVLARLRAEPDAPKSARAPSGTDALQGSGHPDANLLAGFAEKTLPEREREQVLSHLSQCAQCREVAAFALPTESPMPEPLTAEQRWNPWTVLRWSAMAAVLGTLAVVVILHPGTWRDHSEKLASSPAPMGNIASAPPPTVLLPAQPATGTAQSKAKVEAPRTANSRAAAGKELEPHRTLGLKARKSPTKANEQVTMMTSSLPPATYRVENVPATKTLQQAQTSGITVAGTLPAPPSPVLAATPDSEKAIQAGSESQAAPAAVRAENQSEAVSGENSGISSVPPKVPPPASPEPSVRMIAQAPMAGMPASRITAANPVGPSPTVWSVSANGKVQRSLDGGKTFDRIHVAHGIKFRAVAALGNEVWAGGTGGALFHSASGGATWTRAALNFNGNTETITGIQLHDPQHLTVTTASGSQWVSEDGGQNWQKQP